MNSMPMSTQVRGKTTEVHGCGDSSSDAADENGNILSSVLMGREAASTLQKKDRIFRRKHCGRRPRLAVKLPQWLNAEADDDTRTHLLREIHLRSTKLFLYSTHLFRAQRPLDAFVTLHAIRGLCRIKYEGPGGGRVHGMEGIAVRQDAIYQVPGITPHKNEPSSRKNLKPSPKCTCYQASLIPNGPSATPLADILTPSSAMLSSRHCSPSPRESAGHILAECTRPWA